MARKHPPTRLAEPPWTYAPVEVMDWLSSGVEKGRKKTRPAIGLVGEASLRCTAAEAARAVRRFERLVAKELHGHANEEHQGPRGRKIEIAGAFAGVHVRLEVHSKAVGATLKLTFHPPLSEHRTHRLLTELGLRP